MPTKNTFLVALLLVGSLGCEGKAPPRDIDAAWSDLTSDERVAHLEAELTEAKESLRAATTLEEWDGVHQRAQSALSLLRPEIWLDDRGRYLELESDLEAVSRATRSAL